MKVYIVSPSRSIGRATHSHRDKGAIYPTLFPTLGVAEAVRDHWNGKYEVGGCHFEVYEVEARITRKVPRIASPAGP